MAVKSERVEARISPDERARLEAAASIAGVSVSAFLIAAAIERADELVAAQISTSVPADYFDRLIDALDEPDLAPNLVRAARRSQRKPRISAR